MHALSDLNRWRYVPANRHDVVAIPLVWVTLLLSLLFHATMLWFWLPRLPHRSVGDAEPGKAQPVLVARLAPSATPTTAPSPPPSPPRPAAVPTRTAPASAATVRQLPTRPRAPSVVAPAVLPASPLSPPAAPPVAAPTPPRPPLETDLASYIEARRRERGDPTTAAQGIAPATPPTETDTERRNRIVAANLAPSQQPTFGYDPKSGGGVFQLKRLGYEDAEFYFTGWNKDIGRRARQLIEVRRGSDTDIRNAIVRKIIAIIREEVQDEFSWMSERMGRPVVMSARPGDNAALEEFLMQEFFYDPRRPR